MNAIMKDKDGKTRVVVLPERFKRPPLKLSYVEVLGCSEPRLYVLADDDPVKYVESSRK